MSDRAGFGGIDPRAIDCIDLVEIVTEYLDGALPPEKKKDFEEHLTICEGCATYVEQLRETVALGGRLKSESLDPAMTQKLLTAFRGWKKGRR